MKKLEFEEKKEMPAGGQVTCTIEAAQHGSLFVQTSKTKKKNEIESCSICLQPCHAMTPWLVLDYMYSRNSTLEPPNVYNHKSRDLGLVANIRIYGVSFVSNVSPILNDFVRQMLCWPVMGRHLTDDFLDAG